MDVLTRSPIGLLIVLALLSMMLYGSGAISWAPTPWEQHAAQVVTKDAGKAAKSIGVQVNIPPQPPWETQTPSPQTTPAVPPSTSPSTPAASASVQRHTTAPASAQDTTTLYPVGDGQTVTAPPAQAGITAAYCQLENVPAGEDGCP